MILKPTLTSLNALTVQCTKRGLCQAILGMSLVRASAGLKAAWIERKPDAVFDTWGIEPDIVVANLEELSLAPLIRASI